MLRPYVPHGTNKIGNRYKTFICSVFLGELEAFRIYNLLGHFCLLHEDFGYCILSETHNWPLFLYSQEHFYQSERN